MRTIMRYASLSWVWEREKKKEGEGLSIKNEKGVLAGRAGGERHTRRIDRVLHI